MIFGMAGAAPLAPAAPPGGSDPDLSSTLKVYYEFEDNGNDEVGSNNLTEVSSPVYTSSGFKNKAFQSDNSGYFSLADNADIGYSGDFSVGFWIWNSGRNDTYCAKGASGFGNGEWDFGSPFSAGGVTRPMRFTCYRDSGGTGNATGTSTIADSVWHLIIGTYTESTRGIELFVDAASEATNTLASAMARDTTDGLYIGNGLGAGNILNTNVRMDGFGIWKEVLTQEKINWLYNSGAGRTYAEIAAT